MSPLPGILSLRCGITNHRDYWTWKVLDGTRAKREGSTLADFLEDLVEGHLDDCDGRCGVQVGKKFWLTCLPLASCNVSSLATSSMKTYPLDTPLHTFERVVQDCSPGTLHLFVEDIPGEPKVPVKVVNLKPQFFEEEEALAFIVPGSEACLPTDGDACYPFAVTCPGLVLVDKSQFVSPRYIQPEGDLLPLFRRPAGFGKTAFLSLLEDYVDVSRKDSSLFPRASYPGLHFAHRVYSRQLFVLHVDMADLRVSVNMDEHELQDECRRLLLSASTMCYRRYQDVLPVVKVDDLDNESVHFQDIMAMSARFGHRFFIGIDNYTSPLSNDAHELIEATVISEVLAPIFTAFEAGIIRRGFMVGNDLPALPIAPYSNSALFNLHTTDLTVDSSLHHLLGLSESEITALGAALFGSGPAFLQDVRARAAISVHELHAPLEYERIYSTRDVMTFARELYRQKPHASSYHIHVITLDTLYIARPPLPPWFLEIAQQLKSHSWPHVAGRTPA